MVLRRLSRFWVLRVAAQTLLCGSLAGFCLGSAALAQRTLPLEPPAAEPGAVPQVMPGNSSDRFDDYRLGPGDSIFVGVQRFPDLSFQATLDIQGTIVVPLAGSLPSLG